MEQGFTPLTLESGCSSKFSFWVSKWLLPTLSSPMYPHTLKPASPRLLAGNEKEKHSLMRKLDMPGLLSSLLFFYSNPLLFLKPLAFLILLHPGLCLCIFPTSFVFVYSLPCLSHTPVPRHIPTAPGFAVLLSYVHMLPTRIHNTLQGQERDALSL